MDVKEINILGDKIASHWYYRSKTKAMMSMLSDTNVSTILDVGAGSGFFSRQLLAQSIAREAWCVDISYDRDFDASEAGKPLHFRRCVQSVNADLVLLMDVLEHVDDDVGLLREYIGMVPRGCHFLISVPAFQWLWSGHDVFLEHKRRYQLTQIEDVVANAGLTVKHGSYYFGAVLPLAATMRMIANRFTWDTAAPGSQLKPHHPLVNETLAFLTQVELPLMRYNRLAGLTAFCLAESS